MNYRFSDNISTVKDQKGGASCAHMYAFSNAQAENFGHPNFLHGGRANLLTAIGSAISVNPDSFLNEYYVPGFANKTRPYSVVPTGYRIEGELLTK